MDPLTYGLVECGAAFLAGAINAVAGGGSLISFPTLVWLGLPSITANATNTVAVWPGALGSMWGYRRELGQTAPKMYLLIAPSLVGGITGALLLGLTPSAVFDRLVPLLILFATCLFMAQEPIQRRLAAAYGLRGGAHEGSHDRSRWLAWGMLFQLLVGVYGGYFGAGIGILMLAALSLMGQDDIHQMNGLKNLLALFINGIASIYFIWMSMVSWPDVMVMAVGATIGGAGGARVARRLGRPVVRRLVVVIGFAMAFAMVIKQL